MRKTIPNQLNSNRPAHLPLFAIVRHPLYLSSLIIIWCRELTSVTLINNLCITLYIWIGMYLEEKKLVTEFGEPYVDYQKQVPKIIQNLSRLLK